MLDKFLRWMTYKLLWMQMGKKPYLWSMTFKGNKGVDFEVNFTHASEEITVDFLKRALENLAREPVFPAGTILEVWDASVSDTSE